MKYLLLTILFTIFLGLTANAQERYVSLDGNCDGNTPCYTTIQAALDAADEDDIIAVYEGTYIEDLLIDTDGITLRPVVDNDVTIKGVRTEPVSAWPLATENIEIAADDVTIHGFTIETPNIANGRYSSGMVINGENIEIYDNDFVIVGNTLHDSRAVCIQTRRVDAEPSAAVGGLHIHDNTFGGTIGVRGYYGIFINRDDNAGTVTIEDNVFTGRMRAGLQTERNNTVITGNSFDGAGFASENINCMWLFDWDDSRAQDNIDVSNNTITNFAGIGITIGNGTQVLTDFIVEDNTITNNNIGIQIVSSAGGVTVEDNTITGNTTYGVQNQSGGALDASPNWWGHPNGPSPCGGGDEIDGNIVFAPFYDTVEMEETSTQLLGPTQQAKYIGFSGVTQTTMNLTWLNGNGDARLVVIREDNDFSETDTELEENGYPSDIGDDADGNFNNKVEIGETGSYAIDITSGNSTSLSNLVADTQYWVKVYEKQCSTGVGNNSGYNVSNAVLNPRSRTTLPADDPDIEPATDVTNSSFWANWSYAGSLGNDDYFELQLDIVNTFDGSPITLDVGDLLEFPHLGLNENDTWYYRVRLFKNGQFTAWTVGQEVTTFTNSMAISLTGGEPYCDGSDDDASIDDIINWDGAQSYTYLWTEDPIGFASFDNDASATPNIEFFNPGSLPFEGTIYVLITDDNGNSGTLSETVTVNPAPSAPTVQLAPFEVCAGDDFTFSHSGGVGTFVRWEYSDNDADWTDLDDFTGSPFNDAGNEVSVNLGLSVTISDVTNDINNYYFRVVFEDECENEVESASVQLTVFPAPVSKTIVDLAPVVCAETNYTFALTGGYQGEFKRWEYSTNNGTTWNAISGLTTSGDTLIGTNIVIGSETISQVSVAASGQRHLTMIGIPFGLDDYQFRPVYGNNACGEVTAPEATLSVTPHPSITTDLDDENNYEVCSDDILTLTTEWDDADSFQWQIWDDGDWDNLSDDAPYSGTNTAVLTIEEPSSALDGAQYRVLAYNDGCPDDGIASNTATINVYTVPTAGDITDGDADEFEYCEGSDIVLTLENYNLEEVGVITWQYFDVTWQDVDTETQTDHSISGDDNEVLTISEAGTGYDGAEYRAIISNGVCDEVEATEVELTVYQASLARNIVPAEVEQEVCQGESVSFHTVGTSPVGDWDGWFYSTDDETWILVDGDVAPFDGTEATVNLNNEFELELINIQPEISEYYFTSRRTNGVCEPDYSDVSAQVTVSPTTVAGEIDADENPICEGETLTITIDDTGAEGDFLGWYFSDGINPFELIDETWNTDLGIITQDDEVSLVIENVSTDLDGYEFTAAWQSGVCDVEYATLVTIQVDEAPTADELTIDDLYCDGDEVELTISGENGTITWEYSTDEGENWFPVVSGITPDEAHTIDGNTLTIIADYSEHNGNMYRAFISYGVCEDYYTEEVTLNISEPAVAGDNPSNQTVCQGATSVQFNTTEGTGEIIWQYSSNAGSDWNDITSGESIGGSQHTVSGTTLEILNVAGTLNNYWYRASFEEDEECDRAYTAHAVLSVLATPTITADPQDQDACDGGTASFTATTSGATSWQWQIAADDDGEPDGDWQTINNGGPNSYTDATTTTLNIGDVSGLDGFWFRLRANNAGNCPVFSDAAQLNFIPEPDFTDAHPENVTACEGSEAQFTSEPADADTYQWQIWNDPNWDNLSDDALYSGVTTTTLTIDDVTGLGGELYRLVAWNETDCPTEGIASNSAELTVTPHPTETSVPTVITNPICAGGTATIQVFFDNAVRYEWYRDNGTVVEQITNENELDDDVYSINVAGTILTIDANMDLDGYEYYALAFNTDDCPEEGVQSTVTTLTVLEATLALNIDEEDEELAVCVDEGVTIRTEAGGDFNGTFVTWRYSANGGTNWFDVNPAQAPFNGTGATVVSETSASLELSNIQIGLDGYLFRVLYENAPCPNDPSDNYAELTVVPAPTVYDVSIDEVEVCENEYATITLSSSEENISYQLLLDDVAHQDPQDGTGSSLTWEVNTAGTYTVIAVEGACDEVEMNGSVELDILSIPSITCPSDFDVCIDADPIDLFTLDGLDPDEGGEFSGDGVDDGDFNPSVAGEGEHVITYTYTDTEGNGCSNSCTFTITVNPLPEVTCPDDFAVCIDNGVIDLATLTYSPTGGDFSGVGVDDGEFDPLEAGEGEHEITYTYTDENSCENTCTFTITVNPLPVLTCPEDFDICDNAPTVDLTSLDYSPEGGTFTGTGVTDNEFDPDGLEPDEYTITYTYTDDETGCEDFCTFIITVIGSPVPVITGDADVCVNGEVEYSSTEEYDEYEWLIPGIENTDYEIVSGATDEQTITIQWLTTGEKLIELSVSVSEEECDGLDEFTTTVHAYPQADVTALIDEECSGEDVVFTITASGGTGPWTVTYEINDGDEEIVVVPALEGTIDVTIEDSEAGTYTLVILSVENSNECETVYEEDEPTASVEVTQTPAQPGAITGPTTAPQDIGNLNYSIASVDNATDYTWFWDGTTPTGVTLTPSGTNLTINYSSTAQIGTYTLAVYASNDFCDGEAQTLEIEITAPIPPTKFAFEFIPDQESKKQFQVRVYSVDDSDVLQKVTQTTVFNITKENGDGTFTNATGSISNGQHTSPWFNVTYTLQTGTDCEDDVQLRVDRTGGMLLDPATSNQFEVVRAAPVTQDINIQLSTRDANSITINWTKGSGDGRLVLVKESSDAGTIALPTDGTDYGTNTNFTLAPEVSDGTKAVAKGNINTVKVTGLNPGTYYTFRVFAFNNVVECGEVESTIKYNLTTTTNNPRVLITNDKESNGEFVFFLGNFAVSEIYPNPASTEINFSLEVVESGQFGIELFNMLGERVYAEMQFVSTGVHKFNIPLHSDKGAIPAGSYQLRISNNGDQYDTNIMIIR